MYQRLRAWRQEVAREQEIPAFVVAHDTTLKAIAADIPTTTAQLLAIKGIGPKKLKLYGRPILAIIATHRAHG